MTLALIAGAGALPGIVARAQTVMPYVAAVEGFAPEGLDVDYWLRIETLGTAMQWLRNMGVTELCFVGRVARPQFDPSAVDAATRTLITPLLSALAKGDDGALRIILSLFEDQGFRVRAAHTLCPGLTANEGVLGAVTPQDEDLKNAVRGAEIVAALGAADIGQACVVARQQALAIEAMPGTDWMLRSLSHPKPGAMPQLPAGGLLYKAAKPDQDLRVDMPTIGPETVAAARDAGLRGIVIEAGRVMIVDRAATVAAADAAGMFLMARAS